MIPHHSLRKFNTANITSIDNDTIAGDARVYRKVVVPDLSLLLTTGELIVTSPPFSGCNINVTVSDNRDIVAIRQFDKRIIEILHVQSPNIFGEQFSIEEINEMFVPSVNHNSVMNLRRKDSIHCEEDSFVTYDPSKIVISNERLNTDVVFKAAVKPWLIDFSLRTMKCRVVWNLCQAMIIEEPLYTDCILEVEDDNKDADGRR